MGLIFSKFKFTTLTLLLSISLFAGETGKIAGRITDSESGEPLAFANIIIISQWIDGEEYKLDNMLGSASDIKW